MAPIRGRGGALRRGVRHRVHPRTEERSEQKQVQVYNFNAEDVNEDNFYKLFKSQASPEAHKKAQELNRLKYLATVKVLLDNKVVILEST
ncbi:unnamed protein product [Soboliphyme baturini]|uniref:Cystatin domain-containing protein n=1 Tax=Soboliphyme baturini TaxID=241478 RepID=A0A183I9E2_9BILA|nr:unnamed protein product [Soboliphyme baturini]